MDKKAIFNENLVSEYDFKNIYAYITIQPVKIII